MSALPSRAVPVASTPVATAEGRRLWRVLESNELLTVDAEGHTMPDYDRIVWVVTQHQDAPTFKAWVIRCALDGSRPLSMEHGRQLCDALAIDPRCLMYDRVPEAPPARPVSLQSVLKMRT
jgi:hypothetical protein